MLPSQRRVRPAADYDFVKNNCQDSYFLGMSFRILSVFKPIIIKKELKGVKNSIYVIS